MSEYPRDCHIAKMEAVKARMKAAGAVHKKDLARQLGKMMKELQIYDKYHGNTPTRRR